jgi:hypothetical protein
MDGGSWKDMPEGLREAVQTNWTLLCNEWDRMYPHNPIRSAEQEA